MFAIKALKQGVKGGKQLPFRYYSAYKKLENSELDCQMWLDALEDCIDISVSNMPRLKGKTVCLSDNSGSARGAHISEFSSVAMNEVNNLSCVISAVLSDVGYVCRFGDIMCMHQISKRTGILKQALDLTYNSDDVGVATEGGIWEFFENAINNKEHWDNIFIYSDMQAGHGQLYGTMEQMKKYKGTYGARGGRYINVYKLLLDYRTMVFKDVNVASVQTSGYTNNVLPEYGYRLALLSGWTGRESEHLVKLSELWDEAQSSLN
jgi:hypothetical protein